MKSVTRFEIAWVVVLSACMGLGSGCAEVSNWFKTDRTRFLSPSHVVKSPERSAINPILPNIGLVDQSQELVPNATFPREEDWGYTDEDYVIGPRDVVDISVLNLFQEGQETVLRREVSESGFVDMPLIPRRIRAEGRTKEQLKDVLRDAYSPEILLNPTISVSLVARRQNTFSILGAIDRAGGYNIMRKDMRLLEALALAGGVTQSNIRYIYVIRPAPARRRETGGKPTTGPGLPGLPELPEAPDAEAPGTGTGAAATGTAPTTQNGDDLDKALRELGDLAPGGAPSTRPAPSVVPTLSDSGAETAPPTATAEDDELEAKPKTVKWIFTGGRWVAVPQDLEVETKPARKVDDVRRAPASREIRRRRVPELRRGTPEDPLGWARMDKSDLARIIAINLNKLRAGDPRMNIVVRDNDIIQVPTLEVGEFYVTGEVLRPGVYSLTGRRVTVKMALAAAGNLGPLAWPENSLLVRRVGNNQEQMIPLDIEAIFQGDDPDVFLKPNDLIAVGTDARASFFAVMRNAFRMTYGFGFIYDRNFTTPLRDATSRRFTRW